MNRPRILIVDDQQAVCQQLGQHLSSNFEVLACLTVVDGLATLVEDFERAEPRSRFSVAVVDLRFENFELGNASEERKASAGLRLVAEARKDPFLEVVLITAHGAEERASRALEKGVFRYIAKKAGEDIHRSWLEEVDAAVCEACAVRERWLSLFEDLRQIESRVVESSRLGILSNDLEISLGASVKDALTNFDRLIRTKGHHAG